MSTRFRPKRQIICEVCGRQCQTRHRSRDICSTCLKKEPSALCISCGNKKHLVSEDTGLCPRCADLAARPTGECARCTRFGVIYSQQDWLCKTCAEKAHRRIRNESKRYKVACSVCGKMRISALFERNICGACYREERNGWGICARCKEYSIIFNKADQLCRPCYTYIRNESKRYKVACSVCGKMRISALFGRSICKACYREELNGRGICARCSKFLVIYHTDKQLCKHCLENDRAPGDLRNYILDFISPYPYNTVLFDLLATSIDWDAVDENRVRQFRVFGRFLQTYKFNRPLTWEAIEEALPPLQHAQRRKPKMIRSCLLDLGHLLVARGEMESREAYTRRRNALGYIQQAPEYIRPLLLRYAAWLRERQAVMTSVGSHLKVLASFWSWCDQRGIRSPSEVHTTPINDYLLTLYWQWQCSVCQNAIIFDPHDREAPGACDYCGAISSYNKVKRYVQNTVRQYRAKLRVFFDWARLNHIVIANPVQRKVPAPSPTIRHYTPEVIKNLCTYIIAPDAHPVEALILYLIIFHALSVWELRHAQLPNLTPLHGGIALPSLAEAYHIHIPKPEPSLGDRTPGRPDVQVSFPIQATQWLKPLLERYERYRQQKVKDPNNR